MIRARSSYEVLQRGTMMKCVLNDVSSSNLQFVNLNDVTLFWGENKMTCAACRNEWGSSWTAKQYSMYFICILCMFKCFVICHLVYWMLWVWMILIMYFKNYWNKLGIVENKIIVERFYKSSKLMCEHCWSKYHCQNEMRKLQS